MDVLLTAALLSSTPPTVEHHIQWGTTLPEQTDLTFKAREPTPDQPEGGAVQDAATEEDGECILFIFSIDILLNALVHSTFS